MGAGVVIEYGADAVLEYGGFLGVGTNNIAELTAIATALWFIRERGLGDRVIIFTDSEYAIGVLTKDWQPQSNLKLIEDTKSLLFPDTEFVHLRGHVGFPGNMRADKLAHTARKQQMTHEFGFTRKHFADPRGIDHDPLELPE